MYGKRFLSSELRVTTWRSSDLRPCDWELIHEHTCTVLGLRSSWNIPRNLNKTNIVKCELESGKE